MPGRVSRAHTHASSSATLGTSSTAGIADVERGSMVGMGIENIVAEPTGEGE
jgi:hypothetical protein